ncbi:MAG: membrane protein insertion efficiency factor YidD [Chloroflexi bacterium]|nr:membrane protein insertion efficiency factor YidD [Chloroflexota bacterium]
MKFLPLLLIKIYKNAISPYWPGQCRYEPTCSAFAAEAIEKHGVIKGIRLGIGRILRCQPTRQGGHDPVPDRRDHAHDRSPESVR